MSERGGRQCTNPAVKSDPACLFLVDSVDGMTRAALLTSVQARVLIHTLASPRTQETLGHLLLVAADIGRRLSPAGFRCVVNDGKEGLQV